MSGASPRVTSPILFGNCRQLEAVSPFVARIFRPRKFVKIKQMACILHLFPNNKCLVIVGLGTKCVTAVPLKINPYAEIYVYEVVKVHKLRLVQQKTLHKRKLVHFNYLIQGT